MKQNPRGALVMFWIWMAAVIGGFAVMAAVLLSGR